MANELHDELCKRAAKFMFKNGFGVVFDDRFQACTPNGEIPDAMGFRNSATCMIEIKVSRSDFLADKNKKFRKFPSLGMGDWRFYMCPPDLIKPEELPPGWGLLYAKPKTIKVVSGWPANTQWGQDYPFRANKQAEIAYMYSALRRMEIRGILDSVYKKFGEE